METINRQLELVMAIRAGKHQGNRLAGIMLRHLLGVKCWATRRDFKEQYGMSSRECRWGRVASHSRIICGQQGYKALKYATAAEILACGNTFLSQISELQKEYSGLVRRAHKQLSNSSERREITQNVA